MYQRRASQGEIKQGHGNPPTITDERCCNVWSSYPLFPNLHFLLHKHFSILLIRPKKSSNEKAEEILTVYTRQWRCPLSSLRNFSLSICESLPSLWTRALADQSK